MKTLQCAAAAFALLLAAGCATAPDKPLYGAFEAIPVPEGLSYQPSDSSMIETPNVRAGRVLYRGRVDAESLAASMRSTLEADGWKPVGITTSSRSASTQVYEKGGTQLQVRVWEGGPFSWYTYLELAAVEMGAAGRPAPGTAPVPSSAPAPAETPKPSASVRDVPAPVVAR